MDDLSGRSRATATMPAPGAQTRAEQRRRLQRAGWVERAGAWATARAASAGEPVAVVWPRDMTVVVALGVPCGDCGELVYRQGEGGHTVRFAVAEGRPWAELVTAHCGRALGVAVMGGWWPGGTGWEGF
jgi:hypothetical protein